MARSVGVSRERVVVVAAALADEHGLEALTLAQVAARLGVKLPSLYNHVDGLPGLRRELALLGGRELAERLRDVAVGKAGDEAVVAIADAYRAFVLAHPGRYGATVRAPAAGDAELEEVARAIVKTVVAVLAPYGLAGDEATHAVRGLRSLVHGFATLEQAGGFGLALDKDASFGRLLRAYLEGLRAGAAGRESE